LLAGHSRRERATGFLAVELRLLIRCQHAADLREG
jgi:hypothetical protein